MNRKHRRSLILFPLSLGVVGIFAGREMASWRPVRVAHFSGSKVGGITELSASPYAVAQSTFEDGGPYKTYSTLFLFDTRSEKLQHFSFSKDITMGVQNDFFWQEISSPFSLKIVDSQNHSKTFLYPDPVAPIENNQYLRIAPQRNRVVLLDGPNIYQWNFRDGKIESEAEVDELPKESTEGASTLSRDGQTLVHADKTRLRINDTSTGKILKTAALHGIRFSESIVLSPYGRYALFDQSGDAFEWKVVSTATGKPLWGFNIPQIVSPLWAISDDEQTIIIPQDTEWQVRNLLTGTLTRRLPLVPGVSVAALSPDGKALYSVARGVLYRQRAR